jgi:hypothetical protein
MESINWLAVPVAAAAGFVVGGIWYGPIFGKAWLAATGITEEQAKSGNAALIYGLTFVLNLIAATSLVMLLGPDRTLQTGIFYGAITGLTFISTALGITYLFEQRSLKHFLINAGYQTLNFTVMGAILGAWR